jgi:hypothetical protein
LVELFVTVMRLTERAFVERLDVGP